MSSEVVPSVGFVLPGEGAVLKNTRGTTNAAPAAPAAAATAAIFAVGELITVVTQDANEQVRASLCVDRDNAAAAGNGTYAITIDGAPVIGAGTGIGPTGTDQQRTTVIDAVLTIPLAGTHTIGAQVTSNTDVETVAAASSLVVEANDFND